MHFSRIASISFSIPIGIASVVLISCAVLVASMASARELVDTTQTRVSLPDHPARIVTLAPSLGELASDLLGPSGVARIVGVSEYSDFPLSLKMVRSVGPYNRVNLEQVLQLKPDLVLATLDGNAQDQIEHLRELKVPVVVVSTSNLNEVTASMRKVGSALGVEEAGNKMAVRFESELADLRAANASRAPQRSVFLQLGDDPLYTFGKGSFIQSAIGVLGARNIYGDTSPSYPKPSREDVISRMPETIVILTMGKDRAAYEKMAKRWSEFPAIPAVRSGRVKIIQGDEVLRPTLRLIQGLKLLGHAIYE